MSVRAYAFTYVLGGLTFVPLVLVCLLTAAYYFSPRVDSTETAPEKVKSDAGSDAAEPQVKGTRSREQSLTTESAASGTFAVLRRYDFQAATAALNARNPASGSSGSGSSGNGGGVDGSATGDHGFNAASESVYQSMYRSVFDRNKNAASTSSLLENDETARLTNGKPGKRKAVPANVLYIVLRHGHLMLYDSPAQVEVKHVISLAHHQVSLQAGEGLAELEDVKKMKEADLFIKRTAIVLKPINLSSKSQQHGQQGPAKPFFLFSSINIEKEDFYHALLTARSKPPVPQALDTDALIKLQSNLHSVSLTPETRAINALIGRIYLALHNTDELKDLIRSKIEKKLSRIQKPSFIPTLLVQSLHMGDAGPILSNPRLRDLNISGDLTISADVRYNGGLAITLFAVAKLDLGPRFKARTVDLVLKTTIQRIQGTMLLRIKPPPSNRMWSCFEIMPDMEIRVEPVVSDRKITYGFVLRTIEDRLRIAIAEGLVKPNWDDTPMPLVDTRGSVARGGLWADEGEEEGDRSSSPPRSPSRTQSFTKRHERTMSMPTLVGEQVSDAQSSAVDPSISADFQAPQLKSTSSMPIEEKILKRRPVMSTQGQPTSATPERNTSTASLPRPLRSPSLTTPLPSVAVDGQNVEPVRSDDASLRQPPVPNRRIWRSRGPDTSQFPKDALEELRVVRDRAEQAISRPAEVAAGSVGTSHSEITPAENVTKTHARHLSDASSDNVSTLLPPPPPRPFNLERTNSDHSIAESSISMRSESSQQRKQTILAATAAATTAARTWGWNAIQRNKGALPRGLGKRDQQQTIIPSEPIGRGQPLPPPGVPLPGPRQTNWPSMGTLRRKPIPALPPRKPIVPTSENDDEASADAEIATTEEADGHARDGNPEAEDEFGPWRENRGSGSNDDDELQRASDDLTRSEPPEPSAVPMDTTGIQSSNEGLDIVDETLITNEMTAPTTADVRITPKKIPPPLPARRRISASSVQEKPSQNLLPGNDAGAQQDTSKETSDNESVLRVPDAAAEAVAAENATPFLAQGVTDDITTVDKAEGDTLIAGDVSPLENSHAEDVSLDRDERPRMSADEDELKRVNTRERFTKGQGLEEEDFHQTEEISEGEGTDRVNGQRKSNVAESVDLMTFPEEG